MITVAKKADLKTVTDKVVFVESLGKIFRREGGEWTEIRYFTPEYIAEEIGTSKVNVLIWSVKIGLRVTRKDRMATRFILADIEKLRMVKKLRDHKKGFKLIKQVISAL